MSNSQAQIPIRPMAPNPRTAERPMAFTGLEYFRGLLWTLLIFIVGFPLSLTLFALLAELIVGGMQGLSGGGASSIGMMLLVAGLYSAMVAGFTGLTYGGAAAYGVGMLLRREPRRWVHRMVFLVLGFGVGAVAMVLFGLVAQGGVGMVGMLLPAAVAAAVSVWAGWEITSRRALRDYALEAANGPASGRAGSMSGAVDGEVVDGDVVGDAGTVAGSQPE